MNAFQIIEQKLLFTMFKGALLQNYTRPWPEIKFVRAFMPVLVTSNFDDDLNKLAWRHHFPIITLWNIFQTLKGH